MPNRGLSPVLVLISDGQPTDDYASGLKELMEQPWAKKAVRISIAIGQDAELEVLQKFIGNNEIKPLQANNPESLVNYIKWVSTVILKEVSNPPSTPTDKGGDEIRPEIPQPPAPSDANDVW